MYIIHLLFFGSLSGLVYMFSKNVYISAAVAAGLGIVKEVCDGLLHTGTCDSIDIIFNLLGIVIFLGIIPPLVAGRGRR